jgi:hypothetical protein
MKQSDICLTPDWIIRELKEQLGSSMFDWCNEKDNPTGAVGFRYLNEDGSVGSSGKPFRECDFIFCNPPYSRANKVLALDLLTQAGDMPWAVLLPLDPTEYCTREIMKYSTRVLVFTKRLRFDISRGGFRSAGTTARFPCALLTNCRPVISNTMELAHV